MSATKARPYSTSDIRFTQGRRELGNPGSHEERLVATMELMQRSSKRQREQVEYWQGKFAAVKHENNKLRAKLYRTAAAQ